MELVRDMTKILFLHFGALMLVASLALTSPAAANSTAHAFTVRGIAQDVSASSGSAAREAAFSQAQATGFRRLLERLTAPSDHANLPDLPLDEIVQYVRDVSVDAEKTLPTRYIASIAVRFNANAIRKLLRDAGLAFAEPRKAPVVAVPLFRADGRVTLWDDPNPWRAAWSAWAPEGLVPVVVPLGELADIGAIDQAKALAGDAGALAAIAARYGSQDALVVSASLAKNADGKTILEVRLLGELASGLAKPYSSRSYQQGGDETQQQMMMRAIKDFAERLQDGYKSRNVVNFDQAQSVAAIVPLRGDLDGWLAVRDRLARVAMVQSYEILSLTRKEAALMLHFSGDQPQFERSLGQNGLTMTWAGGYWVMNAIGLEGSFTPEAR